jgi:hypothetical protein
MCDIIARYDAYPGHLARRSTSKFRKKKDMINDYLSPIGTSITIHTNLFQNFNFQLALYHVGWLIFDDLDAD